MDVTTFTITVFCLIDDWLAGQPRPLRRRGPAPTLADSEVLTIECVGEFLGIDTDSGLYQYFRRHWARLVPGPPPGAPHHLHPPGGQPVGGQAPPPPAPAGPGRASTPRSRSSTAWPMPICRFARAYRCRRLRELAAFGHDEVAKQTYLRLRAHLRMCWPGVIVDGRLAPANLSDLAVGRRSSWPDAGGWALGDRNYGSPHWPSCCRSRRVAAGPTQRPSAAGGSGLRPG